jgi:hypothetical protein
MQRAIQPQSSTTSLTWTPANATMAAMFTLFFLVFLWLYFFLTGQPPA